MAGQFAALFKHTDTSYKFLWMLAILDLTIKQEAHSSAKGTRLPADDLTKQMLKTARPLIRQYHFRFGVKDHIGGYLDRQDRETDSDNAQGRRDLLNFAPYRLLAPFFSNETQNLGKAAKNRIIRKLSNERFDGDSPVLYRILGEHPRVEAIELHPQWRNYLLQNIAIVRGWIMWNWTLFLQVRNPNRPNIAGQLKLIEAPSRENFLISEKRFWAEIIKEQQINCIYSGKKLSGGNFAIDHYIPHHFIGHNHLWNLCPVLPAANSAKSDSLPHSKYLNHFVAVQYNALIFCHKKNLANPALTKYENALDITVSANLTESQLRTAYKRLVLPLADIAKSYGFIANWEYNPHNIERKTKLMLNNI